jgi:hypothetical protein
MTGEILPEHPFYKPGEEIKGRVTWTSEKAPRSAELRLFWFTKGKGDRDAETAETATFDLPQPTDAREFRFRAPEFPPGFSGRLISLIWGLELVLEPGGSVLIELVIGLEGRELQIDRPEWLEVPEPPKASWIRFNR